MMRKTQKKQVEDFFELLEQAHDEIKRKIEKKNIPSALGLLENCQDGAISLGTLIERSEGEGLVTVSLLENYCELVYQIHERLAEGQGDNVNKTYKMLRQSLVKIENSARNEIKVRIEAVFLPYKASMWDSLESVWKAADADENCDAYVIPIPYYDKNPDGSFREMHYEGNEYPDYVPVTNYEEYDFEDRKPDMIYIHNPYDNSNYVTSVHPFFYSDNLRKFTDRLVYIPYFILGEIDPDNEQAVEGIEHFIKTPGVLNADKVIVESENMRQIYIDVLSKHVGKETRKTWEEKILGLGSPKIDKVLDTRKEKLEIPKEWLKIIRKPDGSWKKIIFYNTSIAALLHYGGKMLSKMENVFSVFKDSKDDVALLWRPHPLIESTLASMRPRLLEGYKVIRERYIKEGWGIYDDSADMDRVLVLCDAYYGDGSSLVQLCQAAGKPVMIQDVDITTGTQEE